MSLTNSEIVQYLADGYTTQEIASVNGLKSKRIIERRLIAIRKVSKCKTYGHLIAMYFRKRLIE